MSKHDVVLSTPDATLRRYIRAYDRLTLEFEFELWDESARILEASGVTRLEDDGTWEADALVRVPELGISGKLGYGVLNVEGSVSLRFVADPVQL